MSRKDVDNVSTDPDAQKIAGQLADGLFFIGRKMTVWPGGGNSMAKTVWNISRSILLADGDKFFII